MKEPFAELLALMALPSARFVAADTPVPDSGTVVGLPGALLGTLRTPLRAPAAVGRKVTLMVQLAPAARLVPQLFVWAKSPLAPIAPRVAADVPGFLNVTAWAGLVVPTVRLAKVRLDGVAVSAAGGVAPAG